MKWKKLFLILASLSMLLISACGTSDNGGDTGGDTGTDRGNTAQPPANTGGDTQIDVQTLYNNNCLSCHGQNLEGVMGGKTNLQKVGARLTKDQIVSQILNGGNGMPAFKGQLTDAEIDALAEWLASKK